MKSILFVDMHREGRSPSQRFRYEQYLPALRANGYRVVHSYLLNAKDDRLFYSPGHVFQKGWIVGKSFAKRIRDVILARNFDYVFVQREAFMLGTLAFEKLFKRSGAKLIVDFDDAIWLPQVSTTGVNNRFLFLKNPKKTDQLLAIADQVVAGNAFLAEHARLFNSRVTVIPTTIDTTLYTPCPKPKDVVNIGWSGSVSTLDHFKTVLPALKVIKLQYNEHVQFTVIGDGRYRNEELGIAGKNWQLATEIAELQRFDIGIMPLPDDDWSRGKCGLKGLQYMALAIPTIMSPVGVNSEIIQPRKNGLLASSTQDWVNALSLLIENRELCLELGQAGRLTVQERFSVSATTSNFLSLFD